MSIRSPEESNRKKRRTQFDAVSIPCTEVQNVPPPIQEPVLPDDHAHLTPQGHHKESKEEEVNEDKGWKKEKEELMRLLQDEKRVNEQHLKESMMHTETLNDLKESVTCSICLDQYKDPHALSCGHVACQPCLISWFRTPSAYLDGISNLEITDIISPERDLSYRTKVCPTCRSTVYDRPTRLYHLEPILSALGIESTSPNPGSPTPPTKKGEHQNNAWEEFCEQLGMEKEGVIVDIWKNIFPKSREGYRIELKDSTNCPNCLDDLYAFPDICYRCNITFTNGDGEGDGSDSEGGDIPIPEEDDDDDNISEDEGYPIQEAYPGEIDERAMIFARLAVPEGGDGTITWYEHMRREGNLRLLRSICYARREEVEALIIKDGNGGDRVFYGPENKVEDQDV